MKDEHLEGRVAGNEKMAKHSVGEPNKDEAIEEVEVPRIHAEEAWSCDAGCLGEGALLWRPPRQSGRHSCDRRN